MHGARRPMRVPRALGGAPQDSCKWTPLAWIRERKKEAGRGPVKGGLIHYVNESPRFKTPLKDNLPDSYPLGEDLHIK